MNARFRGPLILALVASAAIFGWWFLGESDSVDAPIDSSTALREGNRLFRNGQFDAAVEIYRRGFRPDEPHFTLAYNLGSALHHLGELPEAILWYRRGEPANDPWLNENLELARRSLGVRPEKLPASTRIWTGSTEILRAVAVVLAWLGAAFLAVEGPRRLRGWLPLALIAGGLFSGSLWLDASSPRSAILLKDCAVQEQTLLAGTELWVRRDGAAWNVVGSEATCSDEAVELVCAACLDP